MVKRHENTPIYVVVRFDRSHRQDLPADHIITTIEAVPTFEEARAECDRLNALARDRGIDCEYIASTCRWYPDGRGVVPTELQAVVIADTWVWPENVEAVFETLSRWIGYGFDDSDQAAVQQGVGASEAESDRWFEYPLVGHVRLDVTLARHAAAEPVLIRLSSGDTISEKLRTRIEAGLELFNSYEIAPPAKD